MVRARPGPEDDDLDGSGKERLQREQDGDDDGAQDPQRHHLPVLAPRPSRSGMG